MINIVVVLFVGECVMILKLYFYALHISITHTRMCETGVNLKNKIGKCIRIANIRN